MSEKERVLRDPYTGFLQGDITAQEFMAAQQERIQREIGEAYEAYKQNPDPVNHPAHYKADNGLEAIDVIEAFLGTEGAYNYCRANVLKYALRAGAKGDAAQDLQKASWYAERAARLWEGRDA